VYLNLSNNLELKMQEEVYAITDIDGYVSQMREAAAKALSEDGDKDDLNSYISLNQMIGLVKEYCLGFDNQNRPLLDEKSNEKIFEETSVWIHSIGLAKLASKDLIECAWDNDSNEMIFWSKEVKKNEKSRRKRKDI
jgi:hypothetical protein